MICYSDLLVFSAINPVIVENHKVKIRIKTTITIASDISIPWKVSNPIKLPSAIPIPPGINDNAPMTNELEYVEIIFNIEPIENPNPSITKNAAHPIIIQ